MISGRKRKMAVGAVLVAAIMISACARRGGETAATTQPVAAKPTAPPGPTATSTTGGPVVRIDHGRRHYAGSIAAAENGDVFVSYSFENPKNENRFDFALARFSRDGREVWRRIIATNSTTNVPSTTVRLDPDGNPVMAGSVFTAPRVSSAILQKYTPDGELVWTRKFGESNRMNYVAGLAFAPDGQIVVASHYFTGEGPYPFVLYRLDRKGNILRRTHTKEDLPQAIAVDGDRTYVVGAKNKGRNKWGGWIARYDSDDKRVAYQEIRGHRWSFLYSLAVAPDRSVYISGSVSDSPESLKRRGVVWIADSRCRINEYFNGRSGYGLHVTGIDARYLYLLTGSQPTMLQRLPLDTARPALQKFVAPPDRPSHMVISAAVPQGQDWLALARKEVEPNRRIVAWFRLTRLAEGPETKKAPAEEPAAPKPLTETEARALATKLANAELDKGNVRDAEGRQFQHFDPKSWERVTQSGGRWALFFPYPWPKGGGLKVKVTFNLDGSKPRVNAFFDSE